MKKLVLLFFIMCVFVVTNAQTTISVGTGTPVLDGVLVPAEWNATSITTSLGVTLNAMADGQYLYMSAQWNDATENIAKNRLTYNGSTWTKSGDEDRIAFIFDMGLTGTDGGNCATMCHIPVMSTNTGEADLWHWKSVRSNPMGFVDDNYIDSLNRHGDSGTSAAADNILLSNGRPSFMSISDPHANVDFLTMDDAAFNSFDPFGIISPHTYNKSVAFDSLATFSNGDFVSGYLLRISNSDRASVLAAGKWVDSVWTVEFKKPYAGTDFDFTVVPGTSTTFTYEIFNNEGADHWMNGFDATVLTLDFSGFIPVELTSFVAAASTDGISLKWETATETNNRGFEIHRSINGDAFEIIGFVNGRGTTTGLSQYNFIDKDVIGGVYSYRLKQIDQDGTFSYSKTIEVDFTVPAEYSISQNYPNPFNPLTVIQFGIPVQAKIVVTLYNSVGEKVEVITDREFSAGRHTLNINAYNLSSGIYIYTLSAQGIDGSNYFQSNKMILMK